MILAAAAEVPSVHTYEYTDTYGIASAADIDRPSTSLWFYTTVSL